MSKQSEPKETPLLLNSFYAERTMQPSADRAASPNHAWIDDFRALQKN